MRFCGECGNQLPPKDQFCSECGTPRTSGLPQAGLPRKQNRAVAFLIRHRWWSIGTVAFIAVLVGLYFFGKEMTGGSRYIQKFETALRAGDAARVAFMLKTEDDKLTMDEAKAKSIMGYIKSAGLQDAVIQDLKDQASKGAGGDTFLVWEKDGKQYGIYDRYRIVVLASPVDAHTNYDGATIKLNGKPVATSDSEDFKTTVGPLLPGVYKLEAEYAGEYTTLRTEQEVTVTGGPHDGVVDLTMTGEQVSVDSNYTGAAIFIDDRDTGAVTGFAQSFGPVSLDGSNLVHVEKSFPWGTVKSKPVPIDSTNVHVELNPNTEELKEDVMKTASEFLQSWMEAFRKLDPSAVKHLAKDRKDAMTSSITEYKANGMIYEGQLKKLVFDKDSIYIQQEADGSFRTTVSVQNTYTQSYYASGEIPPAPSEYTDTFTYRLRYEDKQWIVTDWYEEYNFSQDNTKEMSFDKA
jgi:uncharacterized membrane protein YvbJ